VDTVEESKPLVTSLGLTFPLLSDPDLVVARAYGVVDKENGIAWPAVFLVTPGGRIAWRSLSDTYKVRPGIADILGALEATKPKPSTNVTP
jgi:peroxiredoxin